MSENASVEQAELAAFGLLRKPQLSKLRFAAFVVCFANASVAQPGRARPWYALSFGVLRDIQRTCTKKTEKDEVKGSHFSFGVAGATSKETCTKERKVA